MSANPIQWALAPAGPQAAKLATLYWIFFWVCAVAYVATIVFLIIAIIRSLRRATPDDPLLHERSMARGVAIGSTLTIAGLFALLVASVAVGDAVGTFAKNKPNQLEIDVTGHQWWWEVTYPDPESDKIIKTANEIHIPVGKPVLMHLATRDVIHSFWVPNLHGKRDLIPGRNNKLWIQAGRAGTFRAQCAEFCGLQHAHMSFVVVAETADEFDRWKKHQQAPAPDPKTPQERNGREIFLSLPCANCHSIVGIDAYATLGPDLTHVASRPTLAAGMLINNRGNLAGWISNAPAIKPGAQMPPNEMSASDLQDLLAYLETLK
ncbi:MAG TPA: cytochrome c oxidase subunit II [Thermoanaerobaculia bacterium]